MSQDSVIKSDIIDAVHAELGLSRTACSDLVEATITHMAEALCRHETVKIAGFGNFSVRTKKARLGRNPRTLDDVPISARAVVTFSASAMLRARLLPLSSRHKNPTQPVYQPESRVSSVTAPKTQNPRSDLMAKAADYIADVKRYDAGAEEDRVQKIVNYCGIALVNKDSSLVSCSDETERNRVRDGFCAKKLGMDAATADAAIEAVCQTMQPDRMKQRVTFLYLLAKNSGKLSAL